MLHADEGTRTKTFSFTMATKPSSGDAGEQLDSGYQTCYQIHSSFDSLPGVCPTVAFTKVPLDLHMKMFITSLFADTCNLCNLSNLWILQISTKKELNMLKKGEMLK